mgnify:CR=1 FL=1
MIEADSELAALYLSAKGSATYGSRRIQSSF